MLQPPHRNRIKAYDAVGGGFNLFTANAVLLTAASVLRIERQKELLLQLEAVFSFLSNRRQLSVIVALVITASSLCDVAASV